MHAPKFGPLVLILMIGIFISTSTFASEPLHRNIDGQWVPFDREANPGYTETNAQDIIYYPHKKSPAFNVTYQDVINGNGIGFADPTLGVQRRARVVDALNYLAGILSEESGSADIHFNVSQTDGSGYLASCGAYYWQSNGFQGGFVYEHIKTGSDPYASLPDANGTVDFGFNWYTGTGSPGFSQYDLRSVILHEVTHALGFTSLIDYPTGNSEITGGNPGAYGNYDAKLANGNGQAFCNATGGASYIRTTNDLLGVNNGVIFTGTNAVTEFGSNPPIYAPSSWQSGSSISHWDTSTPSETVMRPAISNGQTKRVYLDFEIAALIDLGYSITLHPEPVPAIGPVGVIILLSGMGLFIGLYNRKHS